MYSHYGRIILLLTENYLCKIFVNQIKELNTYYSIKLGISPSCLNRRLIINFKTRTAV